MNRYSGICIGGPLHGQSAVEKTTTMKVHLMVEVPAIAPLDDDDLPHAACLIPHTSVEYTFDADLGMWLFEGVIVPKQHLRVER